MRVTPLRAFDTLTSRLVLLPIDDVDTDQIIPARFLTALERDGLGKYLFADWRSMPDGSPNLKFVLDRPEVKGASILLAGANFGCGSSREHAVWALMDWGVRAVVAISFADIFRGNALKNGLLTVELEAEAHTELLRVARKDPLIELTIDLPAQVVILPNGRKFGFPIDPFDKRCLLEGIDTLGYLLSFSAEISAYERRCEQS